MKFPIALGVLACSLIFTGATFAASFDSDLSAGIDLCRKGDYAAAAKPLRAAYEASPEDPRAAFYLGKCLNRTTGGKEAESLLKVALMDRPEDPEVNLELGVHYYNKAIYAEAQDYFENVVILAPHTDYAARAREYLDKIAGREKEKSWQLSATAGFQYDSNVTLNAGNVDLPAGVSRKADVSGLFNVRGMFTPLKTEKGDFTLGASAFRSVHANVTSYDVTQGLLEAAGHYAFTPKLTGRLTYNLEYLMLGDDPYDLANTATPSLSYSSDRGTTTLEYAFRQTSYRTSDRFPSNKDRNGYNHAVTLSHIYPVSDSFAVWGAYTRDEEDTRTAEWDYSGNRGILGFRMVLPLEVVGELSGRVHDREYSAADTGIKRSDTEYGGSVSLSRSFAKHYSVSVEEAFTRNKSNVDVFDYTRYVTSLFLSARF